MPYSRLVQYLLGAVFLGLLILEIFYTKKRENKIEIDSIVILAIFLILAFVFGIKWLNFQKHPQQSMAGKETMCRCASTTSSLMNTEKKLTRDEEAAFLVMRYSFGGCPIIAKNRTSTQTIPT